MGPDDPHPIPRDDYSAGKVSAVIILTGLFVDSLLLAGIYQKYKVKTDVFYPWFLFYSFFIISLIIAAVFVGVEAGLTNESRQQKKFGI